MIFSYTSITDKKGISRGISLNPAHLTPDEEGNLPPSAFIPFCAYQGESIDSSATCGQFETTIHEGQLCYTLDIAKQVENPTKSGKANGLFLLLDPNPYELKTTKTSNHPFKVYLQTLAPFSAFGSGSYGMSYLKKMTGTTSFEQLPDSQKKCSVRSREECKTKMYLDQVQTNCKCIPWALSNHHTTQKVTDLCKKSHLSAGHHFLWS